MNLDDFVKEEENMEKQYPNNYEEEWDERCTMPTVSAYAPPEFMGLIRDSRNQYRGRTVRHTEESEEEETNE